VFTMKTMIIRWPSYVGRNHIENQVLSPSVACCLTHQLFGCLLQLSVVVPALLLEPPTEKLLMYLHLVRHTLYDAQ